MSEENDREQPGEDWADALAEQQGADGGEGSGDEQALADEWAAALNEEEDGQGAGAGPASERGSSAAGGKKSSARGGGERAVELDEFDPAATAASGTEEEGNIDVILDIPVTLSMEIGRTQISIRHLLQLNQGSVVELDRLAGEPLDVMVNGTLIAHGEVVVVNERFGIRLTDVISPAERVKKLR